MTLRIKNWGKFQHFKDRRPPWVKLYRDLLEDKEWHKLEATAAKMLVSLWLIASEDDGNLPDVETLAFRLRVPETAVVDALSQLSHWTEQDDIKPISERYQVAPVADVSDHQETETETETETDIAAKAAQPADKLPSCPHVTLINLFGQHLPTMPQPKPELWSGKNAEAMKTRWRWVLTAKKKSGERYATTESEALDWFGRFFGHVATSDFLSGRSGKWTACDLGWLMKAENFAKVVQGNYDNKGTA